MYDPTIHPKTLARQLRDPDFVAHPGLLNPAFRQGFLAAAAKIGETGFKGLALRTDTLREKPVYGLTDFGQTLVLRHISSNIRRVTAVVQDDRRFIVECIVTLLGEGVSYRMYKFDISSFYESVNTVNLCASLASDIAFSGQSIKVLKTFFVELDKLGVSGLPRGLSISATLAEFLMRDFDDFVLSSSGVRYYSRFVDDICIITDGSETVSEFIALLADKLPKGLHFNEKSKNYPFKPFAKTNTATLEHAIDYLGYRLHVSHAYRPGGDAPIRREVWADISPSKVRKLKTRIIATLLQFRRDGVFADLRDRLRILTGNFSLKDRNSAVRRVAGIRFNYALIDSTRSSSLPELDRFLRNSLMSPHPRNRARPSLTQAQRNELVKYTFTNGFNKKHFFHFSPTRLAHLTSCWAYV